MKREDIIIIYLSLSLLFVQWRWMVAEKQASYLQGKLDTYVSVSVDDNGQGIKTYHYGGKK